MMISFVLELTTLLCIFYFLLGADFRKSPLKIFFACFIICSCCIFLCFQEFPFPHTFLFMLILFCLFDEKILFTMALTTVATLVEMTAVYACVNAIQILTQTKNSVTYSFLLQLDSCMYMIEIFLSLSMHKKRKIHAKFLHEIDSKSYGFLFIICLFSICFISLAETFLSVEIEEPKYYFAALLLLVANIVMLFVTSVITIVLRRYNIKLQHINYLKQRCLDLEQANYFESKSRDEKLRAFRHDFNSHILALRNLVDLKEWDKLNQYIHQLSIDKNSFNLYNISTGNVTTDAIINHFQHSLEDDIVFKIDGQFRKECFVEEMDICIIFSNLLNNAHEAFEYIDKNRAKEIYLSIAEDSGKMVFMVENTSKPYSLKELEHLQTVKADKLNHGFGLFNVQQVSEKYHGELLVKFSEGFFITTVVLYNR